MEMIDRGPWSAEASFADVVSKGPLGVEITLEGDFGDECDGDDPDWMESPAPSRQDYAKGLAKMLNMAATMDPNPCGYLLDGTYHELAPLQQLPAGGIRLYRTPQHEPAQMRLISLAAAGKELIERASRPLAGAEEVMPAEDLIGEFRKELEAAQQFIRLMISPTR